MEALVTENLPEYESARRRTSQSGRYADWQDVARGSYDVELRYPSVKRIERTEKTQIELDKETPMYVPEICLGLQASGTTRRRRDGKFYIFFNT